jgi:serine/threonine protein kinase
MIVLEIITGVPLWMNLKCRVLKFGKLVTGKGLLAANARNPETIYKLMNDVTNNVSATIGRHAAFHVPSSLVDLITEMLAWDPALRISPRQALLHDFLMV